MNEPKWEISYAMPLCSGVLARLWATFPNQLNPPVHNYPRPRAVFIEPNEERQILIWSQLRALVIERGCSLEMWVRGHEIAFSHILLALLDMGRLIESPSQHSSLEKYGISVESNLPRIEGQTLRFLYSKYKQPWIDLQYIVVDVSCDLSKLFLTNNIILDLPHL